RDRVIVFGGATADLVGNRTIVNDCWELRLGESPLQWRPLAASGVPPSPRSGHALTYDSRRDRMIVFGGTLSFGANFTNECWALEFGTPNRWIRIDATGIAPVGRAFATAIYDPQRDRLVMTAGSDPEPIVDLWALDFSGTSAWEALPPVGG